MPIARHFLVTGRVQGVGFRYFAETTARDLGIHGFVWNLLDGGVEALAEGPAEAVAAFESALRQGPSHAEVTAVSVREVAGGEHRGFTVAPTR